MLAYQCRVVLSRFQPSQVNLAGNTRTFNLCKGPKSLTTYFGIAHRSLCYSSRVLAPDEYRFSVVTDPNNDGERQKPEDIIEAIDKQLAVRQDIDRITRQKRMEEQTGDNGGNDDDDDEQDSNIELKVHPLELWMLLNAGGETLSAEALNYVVRHDPPSLVPLQKAVLQEPSKANGIAETIT
jgi:hypothetical protein